MIAGVKIKPLKVIPDERGRLMEILRCDDPEFTKFGQVYLTTTYPGVVKAWHLHKIQTDNVVCVQGMIKLAMYDDRENSDTRLEVQQVYLGIHNPVLVQIPPGVYHGWMCVSPEEALIINTPSEPYNKEIPDEYRMSPYAVSVIPYYWERSDG